MARRSSPAREKCAARLAATSRVRRNNPFVFGNPVSELNKNVFTGRQFIAKQIEASSLGAAQPPTLLLHGQRRKVH
jgi:hypothetical protein